MGGPGSGDNRPLEERPLSEQQQEILGYLFLWQGTQEATGKFLEIHWFHCLGTFWHDFMPWRPSAVDENRSTSRRASISKSLKRLERRGLVRRENPWCSEKLLEGRGPGRTVCVKLTEEGRKLFPRLTKGFIS